MQIIDLKARISKLEHKVGKRQKDERSGIHNDVRPVIDLLKRRHQQAHLILCRMERKLDQDAFDDMFDNMPI